VTATITADKTVVTDAALTKYVFSKGADVVTMAAKKIDKAIELGEGNDSIALKTGVVIGDITANIDGGAGDADTLILDAADAKALSAANTFNAKISGFERLSINTASAQEVVDLDNIDAINYVTLAGSTGTAQVNTITVGGTIEVGDVFTTTVNGTTYSFTAVDTVAANVATGCELQSLQVPRGYHCGCSRRQWLHPDRYGRRCAVYRHCRHYRSRWRCC